MPTGMLTAYDLTTGVKINMDEAIYMVSPLDSPFLTGVDADGLSVISRYPVDEIEFKWMHDEILTPRSTLGAAATTSETVLTVASGDRIKFSTGDMVQVAKKNTAEQIRITGYGTTADTLLVTRGYDGTTAVDYASGATIIGLGTALAEGSDPEDERSRDRDQFSNFTQIFGPTSVKLSRTEQKVAKYGVSNEFNYQLFRRMEENVISREQAILYGHKSSSSTNKVRTTGGLKDFISTNVNTTATQLTVATISTEQQTCYNAGGVPDRLSANPAALSDLNAVEDTNRVRQDVTDSLRGRTPVMTVWTEFGPITVVRNRWQAPHDSFGFTREGVIRRVFDPLMFERLAKTGDSDKGHIVCEEGYQVKGQQHMFRFSNLSY